MNVIISLGDYIEGTETVGPNKTPRKVRGWVYDTVYDTDTKNILGYYVRADDNFNGARGTNIYFKNGDIIKLPHKEQP